MIKNEKIQSCRHCGRGPAIQAVHEGTISLLNRLDPGSMSGMTTKTHAFTLIELLVVVLIIGILSAIALPQYQKAVEKARATQALTLLKAFDQAENAYYLANGTYADSFDELDVTIPWQTYRDTTDTVTSQDWRLQLYHPSERFRLYITRNNGPYAGCGFAILYDLTLSWRKQMVCFEPTTRETSGDYCEKLFAGTKANGQDQLYYWFLSY